MIPLNLFLARVLQSVDTIPVRSAARLLAAVVLFCVLLGATARGADVAGDPQPETVDISAAVDDVSGAGATVNGSDVSESGSLIVSGGDLMAPQAADFPHNPEGRIVELTEVGERFWQRGERESAERVFADALSLEVPVNAKRELLLRMVELYREAGDSIRAIAVLEKFLKDAPEDIEQPRLMMQLGLLYREAGAYAAATGRFYQVLNATMRVANDDLDTRRRLATKARLEIADTYLTQGNLEEARKFYTRLQLLDLEPADRERVQFRGAQLQHALKLWEPAERGLGSFIAAFPNGGYVAEARYLRAKALKELERKEEAVQEVITLLRAQDSADPEQAKNIAYWKRRTGNELANTFYEQGDFLGALSIYQALAGASAEPSWQWPAVYQVGLCFERLHMPVRAAEAYQLIVAPEAAPAPGVPLTDTLASLQGMAKWRLEHLKWIGDYEIKLQELTAGKPLGV